MSNEVRPFRIETRDEDLRDLKRRLEATRWPDPETVDDWSQGIPLAYLREVCAYWATDYDWRATEARLNALGQYRTEIDGVDIHFLHLRSRHKEAYPLLITHGWPGSIIEFLKILEPLTDPTAHGGETRDAFHLVCPTLPGFGYSGKPTKSGWTVEKIAAAWSQLMARLGYGFYFAQGGDWGAVVTTGLAAEDAEHCHGIHLTMPMVRPDPETMDELTPVEKDAIAGLKHFQDYESGYSKQQSTRPQTVGYALADSAAGQAAWILEKFQAWTDCDGHPENVLTRDELLDNVMMYWLPGAAASSARLYWESFGKFRMDPVHVPTGISIFPRELFRGSRRWAQKRFSRLVYWNRLERGGHFAAFEQPELFVKEVRACFREMRG